MTTTVKTITRHAFLTPGHNSWTIWTWEGSQVITNPGTSHRVLESLTFAIDTMVNDGWHIEQLYAEQGTPTLVYLTRQMPVEEPAE